ncbi:MAG: hypothetical protein ACYC2H_07180 [Thermoplasmatota archaeon]
MADIKAIVTATGFLALLLAIGAMLVFFGLGADAVAEAAKSLGKGDGDAGGGAVFFGGVLIATAVGLFVWSKARSS